MVARERPRWLGRDTIKLVVSVLACEGAGLIGAVFTIRSIPTWYAALNKPSFTPPNWLFGPAWTTLYLLMGISAAFVWRHGLHRPQIKSSMSVFLVQLFLNVLWTPVFFGLKMVFPALIIIVVLWVAILVNILVFRRVSATAAWLLTPYLAWTTFATALNAGVWLLNR